MFWNNKSRYMRKKKENDLSIQDDILRKRAILRGMPSFVCLSTDANCNLKCIMCFRSVEGNERILKKEPIEERLFIKFAREVFPTARILQLNIVGEPLLSKHFDLELELAEEYALKLDIATNGTLLHRYEKKIKKLVRQTQSITFSFDSPVKETYESIRRGADFGRTVENIRLFQKYCNRLPADLRPHLSIGMVLMKRNLNEINRMLAFCKDNDINHLAISWMVIHSNAMAYESLLGSERELRSVLLKAQMLAREFNILLTIPPLIAASAADETSKGRAIPSGEISMEQQPEGERSARLDGKESIPNKFEETPIERKEDNTKRNIDMNPTIIRCPFLWKRVYIDMDANIVPCCSPQNIICGNMKENDFRDIWNGNMYQMMRGTFVGGTPYGKCYECAESGYLSNVNI